jgi:hypothetical protein
LSGGLFGHRGFCSLSKVQSRFGHSGFGGAERARPRFFVRVDGVIEAHVEPVGGVVGHLGCDAVTSPATWGAVRRGLCADWIDRTHQADTVREVCEHGLGDWFAAGNVIY